MLITNRAEVAALYSLLSDNKRMGWTCGYHWNVLFEYSDSPPESIDINENCEIFQRRSKELTQVLAEYFVRALRSPSHFLIDVTIIRRGSSLEEWSELARFGTVISDGRSGHVLVASSERWSDKRLKALKGSPGVVSAQQLEEYDTGN